MASKETTTVRVRRSDSERLRELATRRKASVIEVVSSALDALERQEFLEGLKEDYRRLQQDPAAWEAHQEERREWERMA